MAWEELLLYSSLGLSILLSVLLFSQIRRLGRIDRQFKAMTRGVGPGSDRMSLAELIGGQAAALEASHAELEALRKAVSALEQPVAQSVQYVGLVRYNPFQETGGDQSFAVALLNGRGDGIVISSLHSRTGTRFYAKAVKGGTSHLSLSEEETKAVQQAMGTSKDERSGVKR